ncbi:MAG: hypothetical protein ABJG32_01330, partial [Roseibium sp.]
SSVDNTNLPRSAPRRSDLHEARPLLQAIFLGIVLATALVGAAVLTGANAPGNAREQPVPVTRTQAPHP